MKLNYQGHSAFWLQTSSGTNILIDPFITGNPLANIELELIEADYIILSHGHEDHLGDTLTIAQRTGATVIAPVELANYLSAKGLKTHGMNTGGAFQFEFGNIKLVQAFHSSSIDMEGQAVYLGPPTGIIIKSEGQTIYHLGDTALFSDLKLIGHIHDIDIAMVPIGDNFTMGPEDAALAVEFVQPKLTIPIHYNTFPLIEQNPDDFLKLIQPIVGKILEIGSWYEVEDLLAKTN